MVRQTYVIKLIPIPRTLFVNEPFAIPFIPEVASLILEVVLDLLLHVEVIESLHDLEQALCILEQCFAVELMSA